MAEHSFKYRLWDFGIFFESSSTDATLTNFGNINFLFCELLFELNDDDEMKFWYWGTIVMTILSTDDAAKKILKVVYQ